MKKFREPAVAGYFYPKDETLLRNTINDFFAEVYDENKYGHIYGIIAPHAGYTYSGLTASYAYKLIHGKKYDTVVVLSPSHREYFPGISIYSGDAYKTPLGEVEVNKELAEKIVHGSKYISRGEEGHRAEHALEVHIPFLQIALGNFTIIPVVMGDQNIAVINELADKLSGIIDGKTLIVASSDLSHFYNADIADKLDGRIEERIKNFDYKGLWEDIESKKSEACGGALMVCLMKAMKKAGINNSTVLYRCNSGDVSGDYSEVVGYLSAVFYK